jgi:hypothetical protein
MATSDYTTSAAVKRQANIAAANTSYDTLLGDLIAQASRAIDNHCGRWFYAKTETRYYDERAVAGDTLFLDADLLTITALSNGDSAATALTAASYWLLPRNTSPYYAIRLKSTKIWEVDLDCYITLAGTWGWSVSPPADITQACANWVLAIYNTQGAAAGLNSETIGDYAVSFQAP